MAKGPYRDIDYRQDIIDFHNEADKAISPSFTSVFGCSRKQRVGLILGYKIIKDNGEGHEELTYVCAEKSGEIDYSKNKALQLAETYVKCFEGKHDIRPVVLIEKNGNYFEVISRPIEVLSPEYIKRIELRKTLSSLDEGKAEEIIDKVIVSQRNWFQRLVCRMLSIK